MTMRYDDLPPHLIRQLREMGATFKAWREADAARRQHQGSLRWKRVKDTDYLIRTASGGRQRSLGPRSAATEARYAAFNAGKADARERHRHLSAAMKRLQHTSKALRIGHVPSTWIRILNAVSDCGLRDQLTVTGAAATYAYEAAAGVRLRDAEDGGVLSERRGRLRLAASSKEAGIALLALLQQVDASFLMCDDRRHIAINRCGLQVEVVFAGAGRDSDELFGAPGFQQPVLGLNGEMAMMATLDPRVHALHNLRIANRLDKTAPERKGAALLARLILAVVRERMQPASALTSAPGGLHAASLPLQATRAAVVAA